MYLSTLSLTHFFGECKRSMNCYRMEVCYG
jgi:hypothetical protein